MGRISFETAEKLNSEGKLPKLTVTMRINHQRYTVTGYVLFDTQIDFNTMPLSHFAYSIGYSDIHNKLDSICEICAGPTLHYNLGAFVTEDTLPLVRREHYVIGKSSDIKPSINSNYYSDYNFDYIPESFQMLARKAC